MSLSDPVRSTSFLRAQTTQLFAEVNRTREPFIITQNGEARVAVQDMESFEELRQTVALLKLMVLRSRGFDDARARDLDDAFADIAGADEATHDYD